jgi:hypothetical protein
MVLTASLAVLFAIPFQKTGAYVVDACLATEFPGPGGGCGGSCFGVFYPPSGGQLTVSWKANGSSPVTFAVRVFQNAAQAERCPSPGPVVYNSTALFGAPTVTVPPSASGQGFPALEVDVQGASNASVEVLMTGTYSYEQPLLTLAG